MKRSHYLALFIVIVIGLCVLWVALHDSIDLSTNWRQAKRDRSRLAPDPATYKPALVQVYAARAYNWRGFLGVHSWIAVKPENAKQYIILQVLGWNKYRNRSVVSMTTDWPDRAWFGNKPELVYQISGAKAAAAIPQVIKAARQYPYPDSYVVWPGPNSNTFIAYILRRVPQVKTALPSIAIGKDFLEQQRFYALAPSKTGIQISFYGLLGFTIAWEEGLTVNIAGFEFGVGLKKPAIIIPIIGRFSL